MDGSRRHPATRPSTRRPAGIEGSVAIAIQQTEERASPVVTQLLDRAADAEQWERFERQMRATGYCRQPVRLRGQVDAIDLATGESRTVYSTEPEPDRTLLKCCGNRREAVCPSCAETYRGDAYQLVAAGLRGGKGVPESVSEHPMVFVTLTAPSFGPVHSRRMAGDRAQRCRPRRALDVCPHGVRLSCGEVHDEDDARLGEPLCPDCFDYEQRGVVERAGAGAVAPHGDPDPARARSPGGPVAPRAAPARARLLREGRRVPAPRVAALSLRDPPGSRRSRATLADRVEPPAAEFSCELLSEAVRAAVGRVSVSSPGPERRARRGGGERSGGASSCRCGRSTPARLAARRRRARRTSRSTRRSPPRSSAG